MPTYTDPTTVVSEFPIFPQTTSVSRYTETVSLISEKIDRSESVINSYIARRYSVPFPTGAVPPMIETITINLAAYYTLQAKFTKDSHNTNEWVIDLYDKAIKDLELIRNRDIDLVNTAGAIIADKTADSRITSNTENYAPAPDLDPVTSWSISSSRLDDIASERASD